MNPKPGLINIPAVPGEHLLVGDPVFINSNGRLQKANHNDPYTLGYLPQGFEIHPENGTISVPAHFAFPALRKPDVW